MILKAREFRFLALIGFAITLNLFLFFHLNWSHSSLFASTDGSSSLKRIHVRSSSFQNETVEDIRYALLPSNDTVEDTRYALPSVSSTTNDTVEDTRYALLPSSSTTNYTVEDTRYALLPSSSTTNDTVEDTRYALLPSLSTTSDTVEDTPYALMTSSSTTNDTVKDTRYALLTSSSTTTGSREDGPGFAHCYYRTFNETPSPGLPIVVEVFASYDRTQVFVVVESHLGCHRADKEAHNFHSVPGVRNVTFDCIFEADGSQTTSLPVHPVDKGRKIPMIYTLIQCPVPSHLSTKLPLSNSRITNSFLSLRANRNHSNNGTTMSPSILPHLPICSHAWPPEFEDAAYAVAVPPKKRHKISLMTRIKMEYERGEDGQRLVVSPVNIAAWLEHHLTLGMDQIYVYDNSPNRHNSTIRQLCRPYVQRGLVTYIHYPRDDVRCDHALWENQKNKGNMYTGQILTINSVLRRYENETEWMGHWDIDEFLVLPSKNKSLPTSPENNKVALYDFIDRHGRKDRPDGSILSLYDEVSVWRYVFGVCKKKSKGEANGTVSTWNTTNTPTTRLPFDLKRCRKQNLDRDKGIYRTSTVFYIRVHSSGMVIESSGSTTNKTIIHELDPRNGYLAHYREGEAAGTNFEVEPRLNKEPFLDEKWIKALKQNLLSRGFDPELVGPSSLFLSADEQKNFSLGCRGCPKW